MRVPLEKRALAVNPKTKLLRVVPDTRLYVYYRGTLDEAVGYTTESGSTEVTYPLIADGAGAFEAWYPPGDYDLYSPDDINDPTQPWTVIYPIAAIGAGAPADTLPSDQLYFETDSADAIVAAWLGQAPDIPIQVADLTGTPADASVDATKVNAANIDGPPGVPSMRTGGASCLTSNVGPISSQTTLQDITGLGLALGASATEIWQMKLLLLVNAANQTMDAQFGFTVPAGCTMLWGPNTGNTATLQGWGAVTPANTPVVLKTASQTIAIGSVGGTFGVPITAIVFGGGTPGLVQPRFAQNTSDAGDLKILKGSSLEAVRLAA
jgi:hypothetical protein